MRPIDDIGRIGPRPILITQGKIDEIVPVEHAYTLFEAAHEPKELWIVDDAHHVEVRDRDADLYFERVEAFLRKALRPAHGSILRQAQDSP
jgi:fermentation-respiration switch protein FrsA (DUF1100 family)